MLKFETTAHDPESHARAGVLHLSRGRVQTPAFMPVGTLGTVKSLTPRDLCEIGAQIILGNTYHLYLRPGCEVIDRFSGLHRFMGWDRPILTDSGGFQVFSLAKLSRVEDSGVTFQSHIDGSRHLLTPEKAVEIQLCLNSDILMCLDQCIAYPADRKETENALAMTTQWAARCKQAWQRDRGPDNALFGIVQGGMFHDLRRRSLAAIVDIGFPGYAVGGLSVGEPKQIMYEIGEEILPLLPAASPRYVMGVGSPEDLVTLVSFGADMFDCVMPTRNARNGQLFTRHGTMNMANACHRLDTRPIEEGCTCYTCRHYSRSYLRHLYMARELLAYQLHSIHNVHYYIHLMADIREAIQNGRFPAWKKAFFNRIRTSPGTKTQGEE